jgi:hypothetical protein
LKICKKLDIIKYDIFEFNSKLLILNTILKLNIGVNFEGRNKLMKKRLYIGVFSMVILFISIFIYSSQIPKLNVSYNGKKIEALKCPFSWDTLFIHKRWDYPAPNEMAENLNETLIDSEAKIDCDFSNKPDNLRVTIWDENTESYISESNEIESPKQKGNYIYSVVGQWKQGQVLYVFKVKVD